MQAYPRASPGQLEQLFFLNHPHLRTSLDLWKQAVLLPDWASWWSDICCQDYPRTTPEAWALQACTRVSPGQREQLIFPQLFTLEDLVLI